jgi:omega-amidase
MQDLTIALVQANQLWENKEGNLSHYEQLLKEVSSVDLILLPEMFHTAFSMNAILLAETMENSVGLEWLKTIAREKNAAIYTSLIIKEQDHFYNRGVFIEPNGKLSIYDKRKTFGLAGEDKIFSAGEKETIVSYKGWKIQLQICYDLRFPEIVRNRIENDNQPAYDAILYVANWPQKRNIHWKSLLKARAIENQCYVIGVNRIGKDNNDLNYSGDSVCVDMLGEETTCKAEIEEIKKVNLSKTVLDSTRKMLPFLKDK